MSSPPRKCRWHRAAALRAPRTAEARAVYKQGVRDFLALGEIEKFEGCVRAKPISRALAQLIERNAATPALLAIAQRFPNFERWCRRERAWIRAQVTALARATPEKANGAT